MYSPAMDRITRFHSAELFHARSSYDRPSFRRCA